MDPVSIVDLSAATKCNKTMYKLLCLWEIYYPWISRCQQLSFYKQKLAKPVSSLAMYK